jgi:hypothetical protein
MPKYIMLPEGIKIEPLIEKMLELAKEKSGNDIEFCGHENRWEDCLSGFIIDSKVHLLLQYNIGSNTYAVNMEVMI